MDATEYTPTQPKADAPSLSAEDLIEFVENLTGTSTEAPTEAPHPTGIPDVPDYSPKQLGEMRVMFPFWLAAQDFAVAPGFEDADGSIHGIKDWQKIATTDVQVIRNWKVNDPDAPFVMVARRGHGTGLDFDDWNQCLNAGFEPRWIKGTFKVETPGKGLHVYVPWDEAFSALPDNRSALNVIVGGKKIAEWKIDRSTLTVPGSYRKGCPGKKVEGFYLPVEEGHTIAPCSYPHLLLKWFLEHSPKTEKKTFRPTGEWEFDPGFEDALEDYLEYHDCASATLGNNESPGWLDMAGGSKSWAVAVEACPICGKESDTQSTLAHAEVKFFFNGFKPGYKCHACDADKKELEEHCQGTFKQWVPWVGVMYVGDNPNLDGMAEEEEVPPGTELFQPSTVSQGFEPVEVTADEPTPATGSSVVAILTGRERSSAEEEHAAGEEEQASEVKGSVSVPQPRKSTWEDNHVLVTNRFGKKMWLDMPKEEAVPKAVPASGFGEEEELAEGEQRTEACLEGSTSRSAFAEIVDAAMASEKETSAMPEGEFMVAPEQDGRSLVGRLMSTVKMKRMDWLWEHRIPRSKITWFGGKPESGKSLVLIDIIARITNGRDWADGAKNPFGGPRKVLMAVSEDGIDDTTATRLTAAGADKTKIILLTRTREKNEDGKPMSRHLQLDVDARLLKDALLHNPDVAMVALDPVTSYFGSADANKDGEIRPVMESLKRVCDETGACIVGIIHNNKRGNDSDAGQKMLGASSILAVARAAWAFSRDPKDRELHRMAKIKCNLSKKRTGLKFRTVDKTIQLDGDYVQPVVEWSDEPLLEDADQLQAADKEQATDWNENKKSKAATALEWLKERLKDGNPVPSTVLMEEARRAGIRRGSLWHARKDENGNDNGLFAAVKDKSGWSWRLRSDPKKVLDEAKTACAGRQDETPGIEVGYLN